MTVITEMTDKKKRIQVLADVEDSSHENPYHNNTPSDAVGKADIQRFEYLQYCELNREFTPDTIRTKFYHLSRFMRDNAVADFRTITNVQVDNWRAAALAAGMKPKTVNNHVDDVVGVLKFLHYRRDETIALRIDGVERYRIHIDQEDLPSFSMHEILEMKEYCIGLREQLAFSLTFETALRIHEVTNLMVEDMREDEQGRDYFRIEGKGRVRRNTFMLGDTRALLDQWLLLSGIEGGYIFPSPVREGKPLTINQMRKIITRPIRRAGFDAGGPHALRRSASTIALDNGMPLAQVSKWLGHSDPKITAKYYYKQNNVKLQDQYQKAFGKALADRPVDMRVAVM